MEELRGSPKKVMKTNFCIPRLRDNSSTTTKTKGLTPMTLWERFREAVFRLIMFSALSKATNAAGSGDIGHHYHPSNDHRHCKAVSDCIEFIKKKAGLEESRILSNRSSLNSAAEGVIHVPVIM